MVISSVLLPSYRRYRCGHDINLRPATAEESYINTSTDRSLESGMVLAMETPCHIQGVNGFNIEDVVLITEDECEVLMPKTPHYLQENQLFPAFLNQMTGQP